MASKAEIPLAKMANSQLLSIFRGVVITKEIEEEREREGRDRGARAEGVHDRNMLSAFGDADKQILCRVRVADVHSSSKKY